MNATKTNIFFNWNLQKWTFSSQQLQYLINIGATYSLFHQMTWFSCRTNENKLKKKKLNLVKSWDGFFSSTFLPLDGAGEEEAWMRALKKRRRWVVIETRYAYHSRVLLPWLQFFFLFFFSHCLHFTLQKNCQSQILPSKNPNFLRDCDLRLITHEWGRWL